MTQALSNSVSISHQPVPGRRGAVLRAALAAGLLLALSAGAAAARPANTVQPAAPRAAEALQLAGWERHERHLRPYRAAPRVHHQGVHRHKPPKRHALHGRGHKKPQHRRFEHGGRRHYGQACRPVRVVGWHHGQRALFGQVLCVNRFGQHSVLRGSRHLIRYLLH